MTSAGTEDSHASEGLQRELTENVTSPTTGHRPHQGDDDDDPLQRDDPWHQAASSGIPAGGAYGTLPTSIPSFGRRRGQGEARNFAQVTLPAQDQGTSQRIIHDVPPAWDGKDPDNQAEPYLKLLR